MTAAGWPVAVGAGRHRDYSTLLAPPFLIDSQRYGVLADALGLTDPGAPPRVVSLPGLELAYRTHPLTGPDVGLTAPGPLRDAHSRPLRLMYGIACADGTLGPVDPADLETARDEALAAYRGLLADEDGFRVRASASFPLRTPVAVATEADGGPRGVLVLLTGAALLVAGLLVGLALLLPRGDPAPPCGTATPCPSVSPAPSR